MSETTAIRSHAVDALVIVDVQNAFVSGPTAVPGYEPLVSAVSRLLASARSANAPVIFLQNDGPTGAVDEPFQLGWNLFFAPRPNEIVVRKSEDDGFDGTDLDVILGRLGVRTITLCGLLSEMCVAATARSAIRRGYAVVLPHDAHATYDVPAGPGSQGVPSATASRAAEWSLGDQIIIVASTDDVSFSRTQGTSLRVTTR